MANTIALRKAYATMLDEVYKLASLGQVLSRCQKDVFMTK